MASSFLLLYSFKYVQKQEKKQVLEIRNKSSGFEGFQGFWSYSSCLDQTIVVCFSVIDVKAKFYYLRLAFNRALEKKKSSLLLGLLEH